MDSSPRRSAPRRQSSMADVRHCSRARYLAKSERLQLGGAVPGQNAPTTSADDSGPRKGLVARYSRAAAASRKPAKFSARLSA